MQHQIWTKHGRRYHHQDEGKSNTFTIKSKVGQVNVDVYGNGQTFAPYVLNGASLRHGDSECSFADGWQEIKRLGQTLVSKSRLYVQRDVAGVWTDVPHGIPTRNIAHNYPIEDRCTAYLDFDQIQGYAAGARLQVGVEVGGNDRQTYGFRFRSPIAGTFRLEWVLELPGTPSLEWITDPVDAVRLGLRVGSTTIRWTRAESPNRSATIEDDGQGGRILRMILGPYTVSAMEWLTIYPDTWGTDVGIAATADDGYDNGGGWATSALVAGKAGTDTYHLGVRWPEITVSGTIESCYIDLYCDNYSNAGTVNCAWYAWDTDNAPQFSDGGNMPHNVTKTAATVDATFVNTAVYNGWLTSSNLKDIVQEILDSYGLSNEAINFILWSTEADTDVNGYFEDYEAAGTNEPELTITYTTGDAAYFGECNSSGDPTGSASNSDTSRTYGTAYTCPGTGSRTVLELSAYMSQLAAGGNIRLGIYTANGATLLAQGTSVANLDGTEAWRGHMTQDALSVNPLTLTGGTQYLLVVTIDGSYGAATTKGRTAGANVSYRDTTDRTGGLPASLSAPDDSTWVYPIRCKLGVASQLSANLLESLIYG